MTNASRDSYDPLEARVAQMEEDMAAMFRLLRVCIGCFGVLVVISSISFIVTVVQ